MKNQPTKKFIDPVTPEQSDEIYTATHSDSQSHVERLTEDEIKDKYDVKFVNIGDGKGRYFTDKHIGYVPVNAVVTIEGDKK